MNVKQNGGYDKSIDRDDEGFTCKLSLWTMLCWIGRHSNKIPLQMHQKNIAIPWYAVNVNMALHDALDKTISIKPGVDVLWYFK